ncbi:hypothetical protein [Streptomyces sp. S.PB5]|uniref:hypothetical protein n=1 Tax=Streptomyces sp. S.PB5 TaxID=3020844 RepID=UPI0025B0F0F3|nr:hypothetical protein [Streptomyces sp. S.PB5]MDN3027406.1 hypothetical protein [Streptomyces sp. S.PB5]
MGAAGTRAGGPADALRRHAVRHMDQGAGHLSGRGSRQALFDRHRVRPAGVELGPGEVLTGMLDGCLSRTDSRPLMFSVTRIRWAARKGADVA